MERLLSAPTEILSRIFESCDNFPQVVALAETCRCMHSVWKSHAPTIVWAVGKRNVRSFEEALMAVRATDIVLKFIQAGVLPPAMTMDELTGASRRPNIDELREVLNMQHLVRCVEYMYFNSSLDSSNLFGYGMLPADCRVELDDGQEKEEWKDRFYRAMYTILLAGAVFTRPYSEPIYQTNKSGRTELPTHYQKDSSWDGEDDLDYLRQFAVYNFDMLDQSNIGKWRNAEYETVFGPFCSWLVDNSRARAAQSDFPLNRSLEWAEDAGQVEAVHELMRLLTAYEHLSGKFANQDGETDRGREKEDPSSRCKLEHTRKITVILYGIFQPEEITMPAEIEDTEDVLLIATAHPSLNMPANCLSPYDTDIHKILGVINSHSRSATNDPYGEHPDPPPTFDLWHFALRHHFELGFCGTAFWMWRECSWLCEIGGGTAFTPSGWAPVEERRPGRVSWHWRDLED